MADNQGAKIEAARDVQVWSGRGFMLIRLPQDGSFIAFCPRRGWPDVVEFGGRDGVFGAMIMRLSPPAEGDGR